MSQLRKGEPGDICKKCQFLSKFNNQNDENIAELSKYYLPSMTFSYYFLCRKFFFQHAFVLTLFLPSDERSSLSNKL